MSLTRDMGLCTTLQSLTGDMLLSLRLLVYNKSFNTA